MYLVYLPTYVAIYVCMLGVRLSLVELYYDEINLVYDLSISHSAKVPQTLWCPILVQINFNLLFVRLIELDSGKFDCKIISINVYRSTGEISFYEYCPLMVLFQIH